MPRPIPPMPPMPIRECRRIFKCWDCDCHRASKQSKELATMRHEIDHLKKHLVFTTAAKE